jgi:hypothetical protein
MYSVRAHAFCVLERKEAGESFASFALFLLTFSKDFSFLFARLFIHHLTMLLKSAASGLLAFSNRRVVHKIGSQVIMASSTHQASWGGRLAAPSALKRLAYSSTTALRAGEMDAMETGTKKYMSLYPEGSTDGSK